MEAWPSLHANHSRQTLGIIFRVQHTRQLGKGAIKMDYDIAGYEKDLERRGYGKNCGRAGDFTTFGDPTTTPMFGSDKRGNFRRAHSQGQEHFCDDGLPLQARCGWDSHMYRLIVKPDNAVIVSVDESENLQWVDEHGWTISTSLTMTACTSMEVSLSSSFICVKTRAAP